MKKLLLPLLILTTGSVFAQQQSGIVNYQRTITLNIDMANVPPEIADKLAKEHKENKVLYFSPDAALFENDKALKKEEPQNLDMGGMQIHINREVPDEKSYVDLKNKKSVDQRSLAGRDFLIKEDIKPLKWKITGNQKKLLEYPVLEATAITDKDTISAWYTTEIPVAAGPDGVGGLPGLILELSNGRNMVIKATNVKLDESVAANIKEPGKGKKITEAAYQKLVEERREEMMQQFGGEGKHVIMVK